jgi:hypothetical protein
VQQKYSKGTPPLDVLGTFEIELRIALLRPISRGAHLVGPRRHAERLVELWKAEGEVPLTEAFRLLSVGALEGVVLRAKIERDERDDCRRDPRYWHFPPLADLLPELREAVWQAALAGELVLEAIKGVRGKRHQSLVPAELPRLTPDWELARLVTRAGVDEWIDVRVRRMPAEPVKASWRGRIPETKLKDAMEAIALTYEGKPLPSFDDLLNDMRSRLGQDLPRDTVRGARDQYAPQLKRTRGQTKKIKSRR